jgi:hypothetical protein
MILAHAEVEQNIKNVAVSPSNYRLQLTARVFFAERPQLKRSVIRAGEVMQNKNIQKEITERLGELREAYFRANPNQRYKVATDRLRYRESNVNHLIQCVSAVEGFARSVALDFAVQSGTPVDQAYRSLRYVSPVPLIQEIMANRMKSTPEIIFGQDDWKLFDLAVQYRNFLVHEAASVRQSFSNELIAVCERVLEKLARIAGVVV